MLNDREIATHPSTINKRARSRSQLNSIPCDRQSPSSPHPLMTLSLFLNTGFIPNQKMPATDSAFTIKLKPVTEATV
ncbi:hypothetical protein, partial [Myxacorys almedinensis]|uniref:hypothetical protein n=1 Tax=Myxacorys almedinensis TaxID=2651157 RepID=UPI001EE4E198